MMLTVCLFREPLVANWTWPSTSANRVWSLPRPTLVPGWNLVPRWRTMMEPALISSPPNAFTPSILGWESRPLRVEPPPFFCAMSAAPGLEGDGADLQFGELLAMPLALLVVLATAHLEDAHLVVLAV